MKKGIKYLKHEIVEKLLQIMQGRDRLIFYLIYAYGLRVSELVNLLLDDIDLKNKTIKIMPLKRKDKNKQIFPLSDKLVILISEWLLERPKTDDNHLIVCRHVDNNVVSYGVMTRFNISHLFSRYCKLAGIPKELSHVHVLRHSFAVAGADNNVDIYTMKTLLRHTNLVSTEVYYDISNTERDKRTVELHNKLNL